MVERPADLRPEHPPGAPAAPHESGGAARLLLVDDNDANRYAVSYWLREAGFAVVEAASGAEALERAAERPDLVLLDIRLPDLSGFEVARKLKTDPATEAIPIVHLSASFTTGEWRAHGLEAGADAYLTHPVEPRELVATVRALLRVRAAEERERSSAAQWQATFDATADAIVLLDASLRVARCNSAALRLLGVPLDRAVGRTLPDLVGGALDESGRQALETVLATPRNGAGRDASIDGEGIGPELCVRGRWFSAVVDPVPLPAGGALGLVCSFRDVTDRHTYEAERGRLLDAERTAREAAESANHAKSDFLAVMSHELRSPLNSVLGHSELIEIGIHGPVTPAQHDALARIRRSGKHLLGLINEVLNLARIEAGHVEYDIHEVRVADVLAAMEAVMLAQLQEKGIAYEVVPCDGLMVRADADKLGQVLINLVSNAMKFTPAGGRVSVRCDDDARMVKIAVRDTGCGIPADKQAAIFEPFVQVDATRTRTTGGVGLGLAISRDIARGLGGDLLVSSEVGVGSTFTVTLPAAQGQAA